MFDTSIAEILWFGHVEIQVEVRVMVSPCRSRRTLNLRLWSSWRVSLKPEQLRSAWHGGTSASLASCSTASLSPERAARTISVKAKRRTSLLNFSFSSGDIDARYSSVVEVDLGMIILPC